MKLFVGLGNPGQKYAHTRHNVGFMTIDRLSSELGISLQQAKFNGMYGTGIVNGEKIILCKPLTYMNVSGECVKPLMDFYKLSIDDLVVIYDDLDLVVGKLRLRQKGSAGGHNGMKSLIQHLGTQQFNRIRIGIDRPKNGASVSDYVLYPFTTDETQAVEDAIKLATNACEKAISTPFLQVMNSFN